MLHLGKVAAEGLVEVVVGVDEAGIEDHMTGVQHLSLRRLGDRADGVDDAVPYQKVGVL